jgi:hypothetical protein
MNKRLLKVWKQCAVGGTQWNPITTQKNGAEPEKPESRENFKIQLI